MTDYDFPLPPPRGFRTTDNEQKCSDLAIGTPNNFINGLVLHALIARITATNGTTHEFETLYAPELKSIECDIPPCYLTELENITTGPKLRRYIRWLIGPVVGEMVATNLTWDSLEDLTKLDDYTYQTTKKFYPDSLAIFLNGQRLEKNNDGYEIIDDQTFKLKLNYPSNFFITVGYLYQPEE